MLTRRKSRIIVGCIVVLLVALSSYLLLSSRVDRPGTEKGVLAESDPRAEGQASRPLRAEPRASSGGLAEPAADPGDPSDGGGAAAPPEEPIVVPEGSVAFTRTSLDAIRAKYGLPPVTPAVLELENFPSESAEEKEDPELHALYHVERELHRRSLLAEHARLEAERFQSAADTSQDPEYRELARRAADDHRKVAENHKDKITTLAERQQAMLRELTEAAESVNASADDADAGVNP